MIFLHEVREGAADRSYGVQVARLAGLPVSVIERAKLILETLEQGERSGARQKALIDDLPLFRTAAATPKKAVMTSEVETLLREVLPDELSPMAALTLIYLLRDKLKL